MIPPRFWQRWLSITAIVLVIQGVSWIVMGSFDPFGIYDSMVSRAVADADAIPNSARPFYRYVIGLLGATDAAFFVLFTFIVKVPFAKGERWSHIALTTGLLTWFVLDSAFSLAVGAGFNIACVNLPCLILLGIPLVATIKHFYKKH